MIMRKSSTTTPCWRLCALIAALMLGARWHHPSNMEVSNNVSSGGAHGWFSSLLVVAAWSTSTTSTLTQRLANIQYKRTTTRMLIFLHQQKHYQHKCNESPFRRRRSGHLFEFSLHLHLPETSTSCLFAAAAASSSSSNNNSNDCHQQKEDDSSSTSADNKQERRRYRAHFAGASVADQGFYIILRVPIKWQNNNNEKANDDDDNTGNQQPESSSSASSFTTTTINYFLPIWVSDDPNDQTGIATSPESLTLLQLLANVDMAGSILPPNILERIVILTLEDDGDGEEEESDDDHDDIDDEPKRTRTLEEESLVQTVHDQIFNLQARQQQQQSSSSTRSSINNDNNNKATLYSECPSWLQSRVKLPVCTLDELVVEIGATSNHSSSSIEFGLQVTAQDFGIFFLESSLSSSSSSSSSSNVVPCVSYTYRPQTSRAFLAMALALRYKAPVIVSIPAITQQQEYSPPPHLLTKQQLQLQFPMFRSLSILQEKSNNVVTTIKRGFEVNQLQAAYQIAMNRNDEAAMIKIRAKLDEMDKMTELPTQADSDTASMQ